MKGLENVTTQYLDAYPGTYEKLIRVVTKADDALQEQEYPPRGAVMGGMYRCTCAPPDVRQS